MATRDPIRAGSGAAGRQREREALDRLLEAARGGRGKALVIRGEAGVGKSALLECVVERAAGFRVARAAGVQSEMELPFAGWWWRACRRPVDLLLEGLAALTTEGMPPPSRC